MHILKNHWLLASSSLIVLLLGVFAWVNAREYAPKEEKVHIPTWHFTGTDESEVLDTDFWQPGTAPSSYHCVPEAEPLPCQYTVNDATITNSDDLIEYFEQKHSTASEVASHADSRKLEE